MHSMNCLVYVRAVVSVLFLGRLGSRELAGGAISIGFTNITGYSVLVQIWRYSGRREREISYVLMISFPGLENYDPSQAWPLIFDNFVEWVQEKSKLSTP